MQTKFKFDDKDFQKKFKKLNEKIIPESALMGVGRAVQQLFSDAVMQQPTVPLKEGFLRGSGSAIAVDTRTGRESIIDLDRFFPRQRLQASGVDIRSLITLSKARKKFRIVGAVSFNTPYAARLHEAPSRTNFSEPSSGSKYLSSKMSRNKGTYLKIIGNTIKNFKEIINV